jgi:Haemolymph juvenile hormone binding protein (JHBP)
MKLIFYILFLADLDSVVSMKLKRINIDGKEHYQVDFLQTEFNIGGAKVHLDNLFNGKEEELAMTMNQFINENWRMIAAEVRPTLEKVITEVLEDVANKFFSAFPISKLFLS